MPYVLKKADEDKLVIRRQYDANSTLKNMGTLTGTAFELVFVKPMYWWLVIFHYLLYFLKRFHKCEEEWKIPNCTPTAEFFAKYPMTIGDISMLSSLVTFFVVFYNGSCFTKYNVMYNNVIAIQGKIHNVGLYLRAYYTKSSTRWNVIRYLLASHFLFYYSLRRRYKDWGSSQYSEDPGTEAEFCNSVLLKKGVLIQPEYDTLLRYKGSKHKLLYSWSVIAMKRIMQAAPPKGEKGNPMLNTEFEQTALMTNLKKEIIGMRQSIGTIDNSMLFPIPFQYYHIVNVTLVVFLHLLAYGFLFMADKLGSVFSLVAYPLVAFVLMGLLEVANAMSDPFGSDACDFSQDAIVNGLYGETKKLCEEPDEPFSANIGDPLFNPKRNPDGSLDESAPADLDMSELDDEARIPHSEVERLMAERDALSNYGAEGVKLLSLQVKRLTQAQSSIFQVVEKLQDTPRQLRETNESALARVVRLENLLQNQLMILKGELRGDPYEMRYMGEELQPPPGVNPGPEAAPQQRGAMQAPPAPSAAYTAAAQATPSYHHFAGAAGAGGGAGGGGGGGAGIGASPPPPPRRQR
eukprot:CAMPEP_0177707190 /NCGR_PEP_ID=MMETSP0484_2-20121128/9619_1 /TAXON_ID=354590 /ORGANISM="Rhodomonas lens, Strain RHODO" /LENGTH=575 /DNA_ID=CAMNT_0019218687 /DNA_START=142 /DNA_END=1869 /DNA_ORIENTATION=-